MGQAAVAKVSIMMLAYNHESFIRQALESVLMQETDFTYELVIGEDCSTDRTADIIREMEPLFGGKMKPILREKNIGSQKNSADILKRMKGQYWAFLEGDDFWTDPHKLQKQVDFLDAHPEYAACYHKNKIVDENNKVLAEVMPDFPITGDFTPEHYNQFLLPGQTATAMVRGGSIQDYDIQTRFAPGDRLLPLYALKLGRIYCSPEVMSAYRTVVSSRNHTSWSNRYGLDNPFGARWFFRMQRELEQVGEKFDMAIDFKEQEAEHFHMALGHLFLARYGRQIGFAVNIPYMILHANHRGYMIRKGGKFFLRDCADALKKKIGKK